MKHTPIITGLLLATGLFAANMGWADEVYSCTNGSGLHFVVYENGNTPTGGHMYMRNIQAGVLNTYRMNRNTIRAKIAGNTAPAELILNKSRNAVFITLNGTTNKVCDARVTEPG